jgi:hypothetical protein
MRCRRRSTCTVQLLEPRRLLADVGFQQDTTTQAIVAFEAEQYDASTSLGGKSWVKVTGSTHSAAAAMQGVPNTTTKIESNVTTTAPRLDFRVNFVRTGLHYVWVRGLAQGGDADSVHAGLDGVVQGGSDHIEDFSDTRRWSNRTKDGPVAQVDVATAGQHTFNLWVREDGFVVDKVVLTKSSSYAPSGTGPAASVRQLPAGPTDPPPPPPPPAGDGITGLTLVNANTDAAYGPLENYPTVSYASLDTTALTIKAETAGSIGSVRWGFDGNASYKIEGSAPFSANGDDDADLRPFPMAVGEHTITATAYSGSGATGTVLGTLTRSFRVVDQPPATNPPPATGDGFVPLFNGTDLDGLHTYIEGKGVDNDPESFFRVTDGMLHVMGIPSTPSTKPFGYVATDESYSDYHLKFQYKWGTKKFAPRNGATTPRDSGVLFHLHGADGVWPASVEAQVQEGDTGDVWLLGPSDSRATRATTTVVSTTADPVRYKEGGAAKTLRRARIVKSETRDRLTDWNTVEVIADGDAAVVIVNGKVVNRVTNIKKGDGSRLAGGRIAFQAEGAEVYYRDIMIKPLGAYGAGARPTAAADADAVVLFDGTSTSGFVMRDGGGANRWDLSGGAMVVDPGEGDVRSVQRFGDYKLHLEFQVPVTLASLGEQDRGNSGIGLAGSYELQILDSYGRSLSGANDAGAIYGVRDARVNAALPAGVWQTYDVTFTAPRYDAAGQKTANARVTAYLNGTLVHDDVQIPGPTFTFEPEQRGLRPVILQDHDNLVRFRNIWVDPT